MMIFYTLNGPMYELEIHDDKICMVKKSVWNLFGEKTIECHWPLNNLSQFQVQPPKLFRLGKVQWSSFEGKKESFRFTTNSQMVAKIERYMQRVIIKNIQMKKPEAYHELEHGHVLAA